MPQHRSMGELVILPQTAPIALLPVGKQVGTFCRAKVGAQAVLDVTLTKSSSGSKEPQSSSGFNTIDNQE